MYGYVSNKYVNHEEFNPNNSLYSYSCEVNSNNHLTKYVGIIKNSLLGIL